jgi:hypothetical protein
MTFSITVLSTVLLSVTKNLYAECYNADYCYAGVSFY